MIESLSKKLATWNRSRKIGCLVSLSVILCSLICIFIISSTTTEGMWDGAFPSGEYHLKIENEMGNPIKDANLRIFSGRSKKISFEYPIDNYLSDGDLISDEQGIVILIHKPRGLEFGGSCVQIFWIFPICSGSPEFNVEISATGYKTIRFSLQEVFDLAYNEESVGTISVILDNGNKIEMPIYETTYTLEK